MSLQTVFYIVSIIAMVFFIILTFLAIYTLFFIKKVISDTQKTVVNKIVEYTKPMDVLKGLSKSVIGNIFLKIQDHFNSQ